MRDLRKRETHPRQPRLDLTLITHADLQVMRHPFANVTSDILFISEKLGKPKINLFYFLAWRRSVWWRVSTPFDYNEKKTS